MNRFSYIFAILLSCAWSVSMAQDVTFGLAPGGVMNHFDSRVRVRPKDPDSDCGIPINSIGVSKISTPISLDLYFEESEFSANNSHYRFPLGLEVYIGATVRPKGPNNRLSTMDSLVYICESAIDNLPRFATLQGRSVSVFSINVNAVFQYKPDCSRSNGYFDVTLQLLRRLPSGAFVPYDFSMLPHSIDDLQHVAQSGREHYQVSREEAFCCPDCTIGRRGNVTINQNGPFTDNNYVDGALRIAPSSGNRMEVPRGETVKLTSSESITLSPGFSVAKGARFSASYGTCRYSPLMSANESVVPEGQLAVKLQAWPNPFLDALSVKLPPAEDTWNVTLQTMHGQVLASGTGLPEEVLSLQGASLPAGLYLLHASCGKHQLTTKVVKY